MLTKEQAIEILEKFDFFQGQRAGRELWSEKPFNVQEQDIADFSRDVALLKEYINDSVPKSVLDGLVEVAQKNIDGANDRAEKFMKDSEKTRVLYENARSNVASEIFEKIENHLRGLFDFFRQDGDIRESCAIMFAISEIAKFKKEYTEETSKK